MRQGDSHKKILHQFLKRGGELANSLKDFEYRPEQIRMAEAVMEVLKEGGILLVEAGTGTGKTLAYLLPALLSGRRVVISTGTKTLQEQIFSKDLPLLSHYFQFEAVMMKGRANYLCWRRFNKFLAYPRLDFEMKAELIKEIQNWARQSSSGDKEEFSGLSSEHPLWDKICSDSDSCLGSNCQYFSGCFITRLRGKAQRADLIIVNHHLFFADLAIRQLGFGEIIPRYRAVIFDEAHLLEEIISDYFGISLSDRKIQELAQDLKEQSQSLSRAEQNNLEGISQKLANLSQSLFQSLRKELEKESSPEEKRVSFSVDKLPLELLHQAEELKEFFKRTSLLLEPRTDEPELYALALRAIKLRQDLDFLFRQDELDYVYYAQLRSKSTVLSASPLEVGPILEKILYPHLEALVFTSATLTTAEEEGLGFSYFKNRLGLESVPCQELCLASSFNWKKQAILFVPDYLPEPDNEDFIPRACEVLEKLLSLSQGRAFLLFTSYRHLEAFYQELAPGLEFPCLRQGDAPRWYLLEEFRRIEESVLFATTSFWQGVDVIGPALSLVAVDRLPFDSPSDPLIRARIELLYSRGRNAFLEYQVPSAVIMLRQGLGRLIRSKKDFGVLCILDSRILKRNYGKIFLQSLPAVPITRDLKEVEKFFYKRQR